MITVSDAMKNRARYDSHQMERLLRSLTTYARRNSKALGAIRLSRKIDNIGTITITVSKTNHVRVDLYMHDMVIYGRFNGKDQLVFGGATACSTPEHSRGIIDNQGAFLLREKLNEYFPGWRSCVRSTIPDENCGRYRVIGNKKIYYQGQP